MSLIVRNAANLDTSTLLNLWQAVRTELVADYPVIRTFTQQDFADIINDPNSRLLICADDATTPPTPRGFGFYHRNTLGEVELLLLVTDKSLPRGTFNDRTGITRLNVFRAIHHAVANNVPDITPMPGTVKTGGTLDLFLQAVAALTAPDGSSLIDAITDASNENGQYTRYVTAALKARLI